MSLKKYTPLPSFEEQLATLRDKGKRSTIPAERRASLAKERLSLAENLIEDSHWRDDAEKSFWTNERDTFREVLNEAEVELAKGVASRASSVGTEEQPPVSSEALLQSVTTLSLANDSLRLRNDSLEREIQQLRQTSNNEVTGVRASMQATIDSLNRRIADLESGEVVKAALSEAKTALEAEARANKNLERLEKMHGLRGMEVASVVPAMSGGSGFSDLDRYEQLNARERSGEVPNGTAFKFYQAHKEAIDKAQASRAVSR